MAIIRRSVKYPDSTDSYRIGQRPKVRVSIADYGAESLHTIRRALELAGARPVVESNMRNLLDADAIVFPGGCTFDTAMGRLDQYRDIILDRLDAGTPCLGISVGAQLMLEDSEEGQMPGIGLIKGHVVRLKVPHIGWNKVQGDDPMLKDIPSPYFYFAHTYLGCPDEDVTRAVTDHGGDLPSMFRKKNALGVQFRPEKSSASGAVFLRNFVKYLEEKL